MGDSGGPNDREAPRLRVVSSDASLEVSGIQALVRSVERKPAISKIFTSIGQCVALRRQERGLSQREFAFSLGVKLAMLKAYETGGAVFTPDLLLRAAKILETQPVDFFKILAKTRLAELASQVLPIAPDYSLLEDADKLRLALSETASKCDSLITVLDIIAASKNL